MSTRLVYLRLLEARVEVPEVPDGDYFRGGERVTFKGEALVVSGGEYAGVGARDLVLHDMV